MLIARTAEPLQLHLTECFATNWHLLSGVLGSLGGAALYPLIYHW